MKKTTTILILLSNLSLIAQDLDWLKEATKISSETIIADKIRNNEPWDKIYEYGLKELNISIDSLNDIALTLRLPELNRRSTIIDTFFQLIIDSTYSEFPYRVSGKLSKLYYTIPRPNTASLATNLWDSNNLKRSLNPKIAELINLDYKILLPQLISYLENDAATRLCIQKTPMRPWRKRKSRYLSISDVALELIQIKTYCSFYTQYNSFSLRLFSHLEKEDKVQIINEIKTLHNNTTGFSTSERVLYYLNSKSSYDNTFKLTCDNLLFAGDTINGEIMYAKFYEQTKIPCRHNYNVGEILLELGDKRILDDCSHDIYNYSCIVDGWHAMGRNCVELLFNSDEAFNRDDIFAEIIATEPHSTRRKGSRETFIWYYIFELIPNTDRKLLKTLVELMRLQDTAASLGSEFTDGWIASYPNEFELKYRVCDFALVKYLETIKKEVKLTYGNLDEKKKMNQILLEIDSLNMDRVGDRDKMIEIVKKYED